MKRFTELYIELDATTRSSEKLEAMQRYFQSAPPLDAAWAIYLLSGRKIGRTVSSRLLREWAGELAGYPEWLVNQCYTTVGDLSETLSLLLPETATDNDAPPLHRLITEQIKPLSHLTKEQQKLSIAKTWSLLSVDERLVFHKLISGNFRIGVSRQMMVRALAEVAGVEPAIIAHGLAGTWLPDENTLPRLLGKQSSIVNPALPYPFMLSHALQAPLPSLGSIDDWLIEQKWDGIRAQLIRRSGQTSLWSRGDELVNGAFPEIVHAGASLADGTVIDGEILAWDEKLYRPMPFTKLQRRLNRKSVEITFWPEIPVTFVAFDLLELEGVDLRNSPLLVRRENLESILKSNALMPAVRISAPVMLPTWDAVSESVQKSRESAVEGVILKKKQSAYLAGRVTGHWWKLKVDPYTIDAVLIAAEPGHGRRAGLLTDYTFGVWDGNELVPITKAYSGLTDEELADVDRFARSHTTDRHGPVHVVKPEMVFEIAFEAIQRSTRHKSGIAVRFPRILRIRTDKKPADADKIETARELLSQSEAM